MIANTFDLARGACVAVSNGFLRGGLLLTTNDWTVLLDRIGDRRCTPFLGAGVNEGLLPMGSEIAAEWASRFQYPLSDSYDLARVAQYLSVTHTDGLYPKDLIRKLLNLSAESFLEGLKAGRLRCLMALASLPIHFYITTNYDDLLTRCLNHLKKAPVREFCRWNRQLRNLPSIFDNKRQFEPADDNPIVFHLHGNEQERRSLVLTEDDYLDFLIAISANKKLVPPRIQQALCDSSLLFVGYSLRDINFRVIHRGLVLQLEAGLRPMSVSVQLDHGDADSREYLEKYFRGMNVQIYWGSAEQFASELLARWEARGNHV